MTWTKLDDRFHGHPKVRRAWRNRTAFGLYVLALNYASCHDLDGRVLPEFVQDQVPDEEEAACAVAVLTECGLWESADVGWLIHDFLDFNPSRAEVEKRREADARRKRTERKSK